ncbi:MAG: prolipoprotein diacylglyceryl transferase family protein, partial [Candidatus Neomarinimicrobiota bacterium]|nr:prolipoprotein diacylglyceryl transferase family protein [Candidatus Neomarinimicrobiota bacterium]
NLSWFVFADLIAPLIMIGYAIGRIGCFLVGDDYGLPSKLPWAVSFPNGLPPTTVSNFSIYYPWVDISELTSGIITVHPTQLYESFAGFLFFMLLWNLRNKINRPGSLFFIYLIIAGVERFFIEFIRTNEKYLFDIFSGAQIISIIMVFIGSYFLLWPITQTSGERNP